MEIKWDSTQLRTMLYKILPVIKMQLNIAWIFSTKRLLNFSRQYSLNHLGVDALKTWILLKRAAFSKDVFSGLWSIY